MPVICLNTYETPNVTPVIPTFASVSAWGLWNWNPVGYPEGSLVNANDGDEDLVALGTSPYGGDWSALGFNSNPPFLAGSARDQNANTNNLTSTGAARPTLQVQSSVIIGGDTFTYRGQDGGKAYYNKVGQATSTTLFACLWTDLSGDFTWTTTDGSGSVDFKDEANTDCPFPWQGTNWNTTAVVGNQFGALIGNGSSTGMQGASPLYNQVVVSGAGTAAADGEYLYNGDANGKPSYLQSGGTSNDTIIWTGAVWIIGDDSVGDAYVSTDDVAYPWLATFTVGDGDGPAPTVTGGSTTGTIYLDIQPLNLSDSGTILESGTFADAAARGMQLSVRQETNQLVFRVYAANGTSINSKTVTLANTNRIFVCVQVDTTQGTAANQTLMTINGSATGVTSPASNTISGLAIGSGLPSAMARDAGGTLSNSFSGSVYGIGPVNATADDSTLRAQYYAWNGVQING